ncbi:COG4315 family predicted lipoprotein [Streptomyces sp. NPDC055400]
MNRGRITVTGFALVAALALAGCGGGNGASGSGTRSKAPAAAMDATTVRANNSPLGTVLVDGGGRTLYLFTGDGKNRNSMDCDAACLILWPPMEGKPKAGKGADAGLIGTTHAGKRTQATYAGHPLYYYAGDRAANDVNGQGVDGIWFVLDAQGAAVKKAAPVTPSAQQNDDGGYGY